MNTKPGSIDIGPLSPKKGSGKHYVPAPMFFASPSKHCNSMMPAAKPGELTKAASPLRPGAEDFLRCESKGAF